MAKTLTEQFRRFSPTASDPHQFGDGAALHSHIAYDLMRFVNNRSTYGEPAYQVVSDMSQVNAAASRTRIWRPSVAYPASGIGMIGQWPVHVRTEAFRMCMSIGIYRHNLAETGYSVHVTDLYLYLSAGPCMSLMDPIVPNLTPDETGRQFDPKFIRGPYTVFHDSALPGALSDGTTRYTCLQYGNGTGPLNAAGWRNDGYGGFPPFAPVGTDNINDRLTNPWAWLIVAVKYSAMGAAPGSFESINLGDAAIWFQYE